MQVQVLLRIFWSELNSPHRDIANTPELIDYIWKCDSILYDSVMSLLLPNILQVIEIQTIQAIRVFAKNLEHWIVYAMVDYSKGLVDKKIESWKLRNLMTASLIRVLLVARIFAQQLRRHTSLNHLAQAASAVLENNEQITQMLADWNRIDFDNIRDQASWVTECIADDVQQISKNFNLAKCLAHISFLSENGFSSVAAKRQSLGSLDTLARDACESILARGKVLT